MMSDAGGVSGHGSNCIKSRQARRLKNFVTNFFGAYRHWAAEVGI